MGQSVWLDFISREMLHSSEPARMGGAGEVCGLTPKPAIFEKAIASGGEYAADIAAARGSADAKAVYERLAMKLKAPAA